MPSRVRLDHSISGPALDALRASGTTATGPTARPARGASVNAYVIGAGRVWPVLAALALVLGCVGLAGAVPGRPEPVAVAPVQVAVQESPMSTALPATAIEAIPTPSPVEVYAAAASMTVWCDDRRVELYDVRQLARLLSATPNWPRRCFAAYGWCPACQDAWKLAHP